MTTYVALLRGINVGGHTAVNMAMLKESFAGLGFKNIKTYINSGNVIFRSEFTDQVKLEAQIEKTIEDNFNLPVKVLVRSFSQFEKLINSIPKSWNDSKDVRYNVIFLSSKIDSLGLLKELHPKQEIEELHYHPGVLFWSAKTTDLTKTSMLKINKMAIYKEMTVRNINTTHKIFEIMNETNTLAN
jgi:uncharacterized protein (DUF1697 family)